MATNKIYGPWTKWYGGECPVPPDAGVKVKLRNGNVLGPGRATYQWRHGNNAGDIVEYCTVTEQACLEAAEKLLRDNGYKITPPTKPITFEDVQPMTEAPPKGTVYWAICPWEEEGVFGTAFSNYESDYLNIKRHMAYLDKEDALVAARHISGLKGGEL